MNPKTQKILAKLKEKREIVLVWMLLVVVLILGVSLIYGFAKKPTSAVLMPLKIREPPPEEIKRRGEQAAKEWIAQFEKTQRPFSYYQGSMKRNLFVSLMDPGKKVVEETPSLALTLKGIMRVKGQALKAFLEDKEGGGYLIGEGQTLRMGKGQAQRDAKALRVGNKSVTLLIKGRKPITLKLKEELPKASEKLVILPSTRKSLSAPTSPRVPRKPFGNLLESITEAGTAGEEGAITEAEEEEEELEYEERRLREEREEEAEERREERRKKKREEGGT